VIPRCRSPFYTLYYYLFYIPITLATQGRFTFWSSIIIYLPRSRGITITLPSFNCIIRTITATSPVWFKTLSFTYFYDYLQAYRILANSTDAAFLSSLLLDSLPRFTTQASIALIRTITISLVQGSPLTTEFQLLYNCFAFASIFP
jgi:hypothetical protein